jgi:GntR family transcriptional regulator, trigonelline degradation regulator
MSEDARERQRRAEGAGITVVAAPLRKQVIELLREAILGLEYTAGERLVERELCERFGVSRTVIREALRHLEAEGLVALVANRGPVIASTSAEEARALYEVREALESLASQLCAERASRAQKEELRQALSQVAEAYTSPDLVVQLKAKDEFYRVLCEGAENPVIAMMLRTVQARVQMLRGMSLMAPGRLEESLAELKDLVSAIESGNGVAAHDLARKHVKRAAEIALERLSVPEAREAVAGGLRA